MLIDPGSPINQQIINFFLHQFSAQFDTNFLDTGFFSLLRDNGWNRVQSWVIPRRASNRRPSSLLECPVLSIPCHINDCHWVAVTRRIVSGQVYFLYADDMNSKQSENIVKQIFANSDPRFYPSTSVWITCNNYTFLPHSNECGIRTLLALIFQALQPNPHPNILLPYMHSNLAQIGRTWVAASLIHSHIPTDPIQELLNQSINTIFTGPNTPSHPYSLIRWRHQTYSNTSQLQPVAVNNTLSPPIAQTLQEVSTISRLLPSARRPLNPDAPVFYPVNSLYPYRKNLNPNAKPFRPNHTVETFSQASLPNVPDQTPPSDIILSHRPLINYPQKKNSVPPPLSSSKESLPSNTLHNKTLTNSLNKQQTLHAFLSKSTPPALSDQHHNSTWGHTMDEIDPSNIFRVLLQNPNGIKPYEKDLEFHYSLNKCSSLGVGAMSVAETKLNWSDTVSHSIHKWFRRTWQFSSLSYSQATERFSSYYQPGGTLTAIVDKWTSRVISKGQDPYGLGRWSYVTLQGKQSSKVTIITAYRVSQKTPSSSGPKSAYMQQYRAIQAEFLWHNKVGAIPDPNRQLILDLQAWICHLKNDGHCFIL
jgi:hypothetical protein